MKRILSLLLTFTMLLSVSTVIVTADDTNAAQKVIFSESFEDETKQGWILHTETKPECNTNVVTDKASDGKKSMHFIDTSKTLLTEIEFKDVPLVQGKSYRFTADVYRVTGNVNMHVRFYSKEGTQIFDSMAYATHVDSWKQIEVIARYPENAVRASVWLVTKAAIDYVDIYMDNIKITQDDVISKELNFNSPSQAIPVDAELAKPVDGKLVYKEYNDKGDKIGDYSYAGFYKGEYNLPEINNLPVAAEVAPTGTEDDTKLIQDAIDKVYNESNDHSMKIVKLKKGTYNINSNGIRLRSGIVLVGEGQGPTGTILYAKDPVQYTVVKSEGKLAKSLTDNAVISTSYIKSGDNTFEIPEDKIADYKVGDDIMIYHPTPDTWNEAMGMKGITSVAGAETSWDDGETDFFTERTITAIEGNKITVDFGVYVPYNRELAQSYIYKIDTSSYVENVGIENLRIDSVFASDNDEKHALSLIGISYTKNIFIRNVTGKHFVHNFVVSNAGAKQVTVQNCSALEPISAVTGSRRYSFATGRYAQQILYTNCYSNNARHDFVTSYQCTGPVVYSDNHIFNSSNGSEAHGGWSTGLLYDNVYQTDHIAKCGMALGNRGGFGSNYSHGWSSAGSVMWNCLSNSITVHKPESDYQVFAVGIWGFYDESFSKDIKTTSINNGIGYYRTTRVPKGTAAHYDTDENTPIVGDAYKESVYGAVNPRSLYKAQLAERITGDIRNARPNAPMIIDPLPDRSFESNMVSFKGIYQLGATEVKIYVDDVAYPATLDNKEYIFTMEKELSDGVHKIYATQVIDGVEGVKTPDRFVIVKDINADSGANLSSIYSIDKTTHLLNDTRKTFDVINKTIVDTTEKIKVIVNGVKIEPDVDPYETQGRVLVPMRAIFEALEAEVVWDEKTATATATKGDIVVKITENSATSYVNDNKVTLDVPATIKNGRFVVPVRFISESFGCKVDWIDESKMVTVNQ